MMGKEGPEGALPRLDSIAANEGPTPARPAPPGIDLRGFGHYVDLQPIGSGGAGQVFRALDPTLQRYVALKFLWIESVEHVGRFKAEAQAQARIEHDNVCKVYEVGEAAGRVFIAMQYVHGQTLRDAARQMSIVERVRALKQIAEAVHAAHRMGTIHRDVKPTNIMIEPSEDGRWKPYIMDFGLARSLEEKHVTRDVAVGTPQYMAPEQARGWPVDARTDVWGLGATLYAALVDRPPFVGVTAPEVMLAVMTDDPTRLRKIARSVPRDLETIVMKCLEKSPGRRYATARALADDLQRFLDGEPIFAQPPSLSYRLMKRARKHRVPVAAGAFALLAVGVGGVVALQARHTAAERARLAQVFGQEVQSIDAQVRFARLLPLHDTRTETDRVRARLSDIEAELKRLGPLGEGPGAYALGRARLALGEPEAARRELERAWAAGWRTPEVACALGLALGELYEAALVQAERIDSAELRKRELSRVEKELRAPALDYLKRGASAQTLAPALVEGLIAFHERRLDDALGAARRADDDAPWLYEAKRLEGDVETQRGIDLRERGDYEGSLRAFDRAAAAYHRAESVARSDAASYLAECNLGWRRMRTVATRGATPQAAFDVMRPACDAALTADPGAADAEALVARGLAELADYQLSHGADPRPALSQSIGVAQRVLARDPRNELALVTLGYDYDTRAGDERQRGQDLRASLAAGAEAYRRAIALRPSAYNLILLAALEVRRAEYEAEHGIDPDGTLHEASRVLDQALAREPDLFALHANYGLLYKWRARWEVAHGRDPARSTEIEIEHLRRSLQLNPRFARLRRDLALAHGLRAQHAVERGEDPGVHVEAGLAEARAANKLAANVPTAYELMAWLLREKASFQVEHGDDVTDTLAEARRQLDVAEHMEPNDQDAFIGEAELDLIEARALERRKQPARAVLQHAAASASRALQLNANQTDALGALAEVRLLQFGEGGAPALLDEGVKLCDRALAENPSLARIHATRGRLLLALAKLRHDPARERDGQAALDRAREIDPLVR
jgi:serine/threonine-protein kinase